MAIDMASDEDMAICVMKDDIIVYVGSFSDYDQFNETVQRLQKTYDIPNNQIMYENGN